MHKGALLPRPALCVPSTALISRGLFPSGTNQCSRHLKHLALAVIQSAALHIGVYNKLVTTDTPDAFVEQTPHDPIAVDKRNCVASNGDLRNSRVVFNKQPVHPRPAILVLRA